MADTLRISLNGVPLVADVVTLGSSTGGFGSAANPIVVSSGATGGTADQVQGNVASATTDSGNPVKVGGVFNTTPATLTTGQRGDLQVDSSGNLKVLLSIGNIALATGSAPTDASANGVAGVLVRSFGLTFNGTTWDRQRKANVFARVASSAAAGNPASAKASAGDVMCFWGQCGATAAFLQIYNKASAPTIGTDTPVLTFPIPANTVFSQAVPNGGAYLGTGIAFAFTTDAAGTTGSAAAAVTAFSLLVA